MEYKCTICVKNYSSYQSLWIHNKKFHTIASTSQSTKHIQTETKHIQNNAKIEPLDKSICEYCKKTLSNSQSRWRHQKICKEKARIDKEQEDKMTLKQELAKIKKDLKLELEIKFNKLNKKSANKIINYNVSNNVSNVNSNNTLSLCKLGGENVDLLTKDERKNILSQNKNSIVSLVEHLNFNQRLPQNHIFYVSSLNDKHVNTFDLETNSMVKQSKKDLFDKLLFNQMKKLEIICKKSKKQDVFNGLNAIIYLDKNKKEFVNQVNMLSYNKRNMILKTWNNLINRSDLSDEDIVLNFQHQVNEITNNDACTANNKNKSDTKCDTSSNSDSTTDSETTSESESEDDCPQLIFKPRVKPAEKHIEL
jgi:hypothetical protein